MQQQKKLLSDQTLLDEAAELFLSIHGKEVSSSDWDACESWANQSPAHRSALDEVISMWEYMDYVDDLPWPTKAELAADQYEPDAPVPVAETNSQKSPWFYSFIKKPGGRRTISRRQPITWLATGGVFAAAVGALLIGYLFIQPLETGPTSFATTTGEHHLLSMPDGSQVFLGAESMVVTHYSPQERRIDLTAGEAYFTVKQDPDRPFVVFVDNTQVRAIGTSFNIRKGQEEIVVSVVEGTVGIRKISLLERQTTTGERGANIEPIMLSPSLLTQGQQIKFSSKSGFDEIMAVNVEQVVSWRDGRLSFSGEPLRSVIAKVNRYSRQKIVIGDERLGDLLFSGVVHRDQILEWVGALEGAFPVKVTFNSDENQIFLNPGSDS